MASVRRPLRLISIVLTNPKPKNPNPKRQPATTLPHALRPTLRKETLFGLWSNDFSLVTGQAIVTARAAAVLRRTGVREFTYRGPGLAMLLTWLGSTAQLWWAAALGRIGTLYLVCSRSNIGFLRDVPAYLVRILGVRVVVHVHGSDIVDLIQRRCIGSIAHALLRNCELILPSRHLVDPLRKLGIHSLHVCENFVTDSPPGEQHEGWSGSPAQDGAQLTVLWNSNIMASKGFFVVAEAVASMHREGQDVRLIVLGAVVSDELMSAAQTQQRLNALRLEPWLDFRGLVDRLTSTQSLSESDVVCLPSTFSSECQPLAVLEAMCSGKRLVIANTPPLIATVGDYPCERVESVTSESVRAAINRTAAETYPQASFELAAAAARIRFSADRFDSDLALILDMAASPRT